MVALIPFLFLFFSSFASSQAQRGPQQLALPSLSSLNLTSADSPLAFLLPQSATLVTLSISLCTSSSSLPRFFVTNASQVTITQPESFAGVLELLLDGGLVEWQGGTPNGGSLAVFAPSTATASDLWNFEIGVSNSTPVHAILNTPPLFGDTTSSQSLLLSPPFIAPPLPYPIPTFPNYTLPPANLSIPSSPPSSLSPSHFLVLTLTSVPLPLNKSACALRLVVPPNITSQELILRDDDGWRTQFIVEKLTPSTNYTAYVLVNDTMISGPIYFTTKSATFPCSLVHSLPFCPSTHYSTPLPPPPAPATSYDSSNLPTSISDYFLSNLGNFTTSLLTFPCGRDLYSPVQTCASCQSSYRTWLCSASFPRCAESLPSLIPPPALLPYTTPPSQPRSLVYSQFTQPYSELLPCVEQCFSVARACPAFLGWSCPVYAVNANASYGIGFIDSADEGKDEGGGIPGVAQDGLGNVWCNAG